MAPPGSSLATEGLRFTKMSGAGNDFVVLVDPPSGLELDELSRLLCRRGTSVGADGLFTLHRIPGGARMTHHNADGGVAELCLNGTRCAAAMALRLGWGEHDTDRVLIETGAGPVRAGRGGEGIRMQVPVPGPVRDLALDLGDRAGGLDLAHIGLPTQPGEPTQVRASFCDTGVPHLVVEVAPEVLPSLDLDRLGPPLRGHSALGPAGANVDFVATTGEPVALRTFERGVEGETLACGTGAVACAAVRLRGADGACTFRTRGGFDLLVEARSSATGTDWTLTGEARFVFEGILGDGALVRTRTSD